MTNITHEHLREIIQYDSETGIFTWSRPHTPGVGAGRIAGSLSGKGYLQIGVFGKMHQGHRLAWFWMTGEWPPYAIDHRDGDPTNNRWANLRLATRKQNAANARLPRTSTTGLKGVSFHKSAGLYRATIFLNGKHKHLGTSACPAVAHFLYVIAAEKARGEFARIR